MMSFFMSSILGRSRDAPVPVTSGDEADQTVSRSRAPVSDDGWRSFDIARASI